MPIKAIKLRAGFLLLLFTLMFLSTNSLITKVNAETLEESFKSSPLPFWEIDNENILTQYGTNSQDILFGYGDYLEDFNDVSDWIKHTDCEDEDIYFSQNGIGHFEFNYAGGTDYDQIYQKDMNINGGYYIEIQYRTTKTGSWIFLRGHEGTTPAGAHVWNTVLTGSLTWTTLKIHKSGDFDVLILRSYLTSESANIEIKYIHIWKDYQEDCTDVSDWSYDSSTGLDSWKYDFKAINGIGELWTYTGVGPTDEWVIYKTPLDYLITSKTRLEMKSKVENSEITLSVGISYDASFLWLLTNDETTYQVQNYDLSTIKGSTITYVKIKNDDIPDANAWARNWTAYFDYINIWEEGGTLNVSIPLEQFKNHKLEFMIDTNDLTEQTKLDFGIFQDYESMNYDFSIQNKFYTQRDFSFNLSKYNYLRFKLELKYSTNLFKISVYDENNSKIGDNIIYEYVRKTGNQFIISSNNFTGWFYLYYFTGTIDYSSEWNRDISSEDLEVYQTDYNTELATTTTTLSHFSTRNIFVAGFQFWRSEYLIDFDLTGYGAGDTLKIFLNATFEFYYPNGSLQYVVFADIIKVLDFGISTFRYGHIKVFYYENGIGSLVYDSPAGAHMTSEVTGTQTGKFAIWRTQENHLGIKYLGAEWASPYIESDVYTTWISEYTLNNFQCNITHEFQIIYDGFTNVGIILSFDALEYSYAQLSGVSEPHFSSTWWDSIPIIGPLINALIIMGNAIALAIEAGLLPISLIIDAVGVAIIAGLSSAIGDVAGSVWGLFESTLDAFGVSIDAIANDVWGFFETILDTISGVIDDIYSVINDTYTLILNLSNNLIASISTGITNALVPAIIAGIESIIDATFALWEYQLNIVGTALGWGTVGTFLFDFTDSVVIAVPSWLSFIVNTISSMVAIIVWVNTVWSEYGPMLILFGSVMVMFDILGALLTMDNDIILECVGKYLSVIEKIITFMYNIISTVLSAIWGILPF